MLGFILAMIIGGFIIGALGRLVVPGPNPIGVVRTILVGWAGSLVGGLVGRWVFGWRYSYSGLLAVVVAVIFTAVIVYAMDGRYRRSTRYRRGRSWGYRR